MYNILVCGDRNWTEYSIIFEALTKVWNDVGKLKKQEHDATEYGKFKFSPANILVIHGGANGADKLAGKAAFMLGMGTRVHPAEWDKYKRGAGPVRNSLMLKVNRVNQVLAFHDDLKNSRGTRDMIEKAVKAHLPVRHYKSDGSFVELENLTFEL